MSSLAFAGGSSSDPKKAFAKGLSSTTLTIGSMELLPRESCTLNELNLALDGLENVSPKNQRLMLEAFAVCIASDQHVTVDETELFRVISDALGCPMPPII